MTRSAGTCVRGRWEPHAHFESGRQGGGILLSCRLLRNSRDLAVGLSVGTDLDSHTFPKWNASAVHEKVNDANGPGFASPVLLHHHTGGLCHTLCGSQQLRTTPAAAKKT